MSFFIFVSILIDDDKMILCKTDSFNDMEESARQQLIKKAFSGTNLRRKNLINFSKRISYRVMNPNYLHSTKFHKQIKQFKEGNQWDESPYMAFWIHKKAGVQYLTTSAGDL